MSKTEYYHSCHESDTARIGAQIADQLTLPACVYVTGDLGAGKTTLIRAIVQAMGYRGLVTSPTYNLIHEYPISNGVIYHLDLYRLTGAEELDYLGLADFCSVNSLFLIEWPERGEGRLPAATQSLHLSVVQAANEKNINTTERSISFTRLAVQ